MEATASEEPTSIKSPKATLSSTPYLSRGAICLVSLALALCLHILVDSWGMGDPLHVCRAVWQEGRAFAEALCEGAREFELLELSMLGFLACLFYFLLYTLWTTTFVSQVQSCMPAPGPCFAQRISLAEYERQSQEFTRQQVRALMESQAYKQKMFICGADEAAWNWQRRGTRTPFQRSEEQEYLQTVESLSHPPEAPHEKPSPGFLSSIVSSIASGPCGFPANNCLLKPEAECNITSSSQVSQEHQ